MMIKRLSIIAVSLMIISLTSCSAPNKSIPEYIKITPQEAMAMMSIGDAVVLDVRTEGEFKEGHIKNAILLPYDQIYEQAENILIDKSQIILVYCRTGKRSEIAAKALIDMGYTKVFDFGGIVDWTGDVVRDATDAGDH